MGVPIVITYFNLIFQEITILGIPARTMETPMTPGGAAWRCTQDGRLNGSLATRCCPSSFAKLVPVTPITHYGLW